MPLSNHSGILEIYEENPQTNMRCIALKPQQMETPLYSTSSFTNSIFLSID